jgi:hypothetical protein
VNKNHRYPPQGLVDEFLLAASAQMAGELKAPSLFFPLSLFDQVDGCSCPLIGGRHTEKILKIY